jgi:hypothetical protein
MRAEANKIRGSSSAARPLVALDGALAESVGHEPQLSRLERRLVDAGVRAHRDRDSAQPSRRTMPAAGLYLALRHRFQRSVEAKTSGHGQVVDAAG